MSGAILRDKHGFFWIAAVGGLFRYDGYELKKIKPGSDAGFWFVSIVEDRDGVLWFGTHDGGVTKFDKHTNQSTHYKHNAKNAKNSISSNIMPHLPQTLFVDNDNKLWLATENHGLNKFDKVSNSWAHYLHNPENNNSLSSNKVTAITEDKNGLLWIGTMNGGLNRFDRQSDIWEQYKHNPDDGSTLSDNYVQSIIEDANGTIWVGTRNGGLNKFNRDSNSFIHYKHDPNNPNTIGDNNVFQILADNSNRLWICKHLSKNKNAGLTILDIKTETFTRYYSDAKKTFSPSSNMLASVYEDRKTGIFWLVNSYSGEIDKYDKNSLKFKRWDFENNYPDSFREKTCKTIYEDSQEIIWLGTFSGLCKYDRKTDKFTTYTADMNDSKSLPYTMITTILEDSTGAFWLTSNNVLCLFDRKTGQVIKQYKHNPKDPNSLTNAAYFRSLIQDKDNPDIL